MKLLTAEALTEYLSILHYFPTLRDDDAENAATIADLIEWCESRTDDVTSPAVARSTARGFLCGIMRYGREEDSSELVAMARGVLALLGYPMGDSFPICYFTAHLVDSFRDGVEVIDACDSVRELVRALHCRDCA